MSDRKLIKDEIEEVVDELKWGHPETRKAAAIKLGRIRHIEVIPHLIEAIKKDEYTFTRVSAIQSLGWIANPKALDVLLDVILNDTDTLVRKTAIITVGGFRDEKAIDTLNCILNNNTEEEELRNAASLAIEVIKGITADYSQQS